MVSILTDFYNLDPSYSIARCVCNQLKMLREYKPNLIVRSNFDALMKARELGANVIAVNPGETGSNTVKVTPNSEQEIQALTVQLEKALDDVVITHDLIFQPNLWKYHVACHRLKKPRYWLHFVHSVGRGAFRGKGKYRKELSEKIPNSKLVVFHKEEFERKSSTFGYKPDETIIIPNAIDFLDGMHDVTRKIAIEFGLMKADIVAVYPCRLDRGKQPEIIIEIFEHLQEYDARIVIVDFASVSGDKAAYRAKLKRLARDKNVPAFFTSDLEGSENGAPYSYCVPHQVVMELFEIGDILVHPSRSESDPLILQEAIWKRNGLVLNFDLPVFHQYQAIFGKFSSNIDLLNGMFGETTTAYDNRSGYMKDIAHKIIYQMNNNPVLSAHAKTRKERSIQGVAPLLVSDLSARDI